MDVKIFKTTIDDCVSRQGLKKKGSYYYADSNDILTVIGLQKSSYANGYYLNLGYIIKQLRPNLEKPGYADGDFRLRFDFDKEKNDGDFYDLDQHPDADKVKLEAAMEENLRTYVTQITSLDALKQFLAGQPHLLNIARYEAKQLLGFMK